MSDYIICEMNCFVRNLIGNFILKYVRKLLVWVDLKMLTCFYCMRLILYIFRIDFI